MADHAISFNKNCTCIQNSCPIWGNCVLCIEDHKAGRNHLPECMQDMIRQELSSLCTKVEFDPVERRPGHSVFDDLDKPKFVADSIARHVT